MPFTIEYLGRELRVSVIANAIEFRVVSAVNESLFPKFLRLVVFYIVHVLRNHTPFGRTSNRVCMAFFYDLFLFRELMLAVL